MLSMVQSVELVSIRRWVAMDVLLLCLDYFGFLEIILVCHFDPVTSLVVYSLSVQVDLACIEPNQRRYRNLLLAEHIYDIHQRWPSLTKHDGNGVPVPEATSIPFVFYIGARVHKLDSGYSRSWCQRLMATLKTMFHQLRRNVIWLALLKMMMMTAAWEIFVCRRMVTCTRVLTSIMRLFSRLSSIEYPRFRWGRIKYSLAFQGLYRRSTSSKRD